VHSISAPADPVTRSETSESAAGLQGFLAGKHSLRSAASTAERTLLPPLLAYALAEGPSTSNAHRHFSAMIKERKTARMSTGGKPPRPQQSTSAKDIKENNLKTRKRVQTDPTSTQAGSSSWVGGPPGRLH
ncbi:hypothetical protein OC834_007660, partial [Tilletia horrida]